LHLPEGIDINYLIEDLRIFSWEAAEILLYYSNQFRNEKAKNDLIKVKANNEPVTLADLKVNELMIKRIGEKYQHVEWHLLSEENGIIKFSNEDINTNWLWVLDPLDGTKDFLEKTNDYALHLALNYKNKPLIGIVLIPEKEELWISNYKSVWCENKDGFKTKTKLSNRRELKNMKLVSSRNHKDPTLQNIIQIIGFKESINMGSIGCKIASILRGESDIYISLSLPGKSSPKDWDFAAPDALLRSAGGIITNLDNQDLIYNKPNFEQKGMIIASNNKNNHKNICKQIKLILKENKICLN
tara:strand:- start:642 stop:1541 length:900 start_codon:yes stop_codon:yes gene_type:complete